LDLQFTKYCNKLARFSELIYNFFSPDRPRQRSAESGDPDLYDISETVRLPDDQHQRLRRRIRAGDNLIKLFTSVSYQFS